MSSLRLALANLLMGLCVLCSCGTLVLAQEPAEDNTPKLPGDATPLVAETPNAQADQAPTPGYPIDNQVRPALKAVPWMGSTTPLRWGPVYIGDFTADQVRDNFAPAASGPASILDLTIFRTTLVFDKTFAKQDIVLQYTPQMAILNGNVASNVGADNGVMFATTFQFTPRLSLKAEDDFVQVNSRQLYPPTYLGVDAAAGNLIQNYFLATAGQYLMNEVSGVLTYQVNPRDVLTVSPAYRYKTNYGGYNEPNYVATGHTIATAVAYTHGLTARQNLGATYELQILNATNVAGVAGTAGTYFNDVGLFYGIQLSRTWWMRTALGVEHVNYNGFEPNTTKVAAGFRLVRNFARHSVLALSYDRGATNENYIAARVAQRADASYETPLGKRFTWNAGAGFYNETGPDPRTKAYYAVTKFTYALHKNTSLYVVYAHMFQDSTSPQLLSGVRNTIDFGFKWEPPGLPKHE